LCHRHDGRLGRAPSPSSRLGVAEPAGSFEQPVVPGAQKLAEATKISHQVGVPGRSPKRH
jgi:hypothetical protein